MSDTQPLDVHAILGAAVSSQEVVVPAVPVVEPPIVVPRDPAVEAIGEALEAVAAVAEATINAMGVQEITNKDKVFNLSKELDEMKKRKKEICGILNGEIKRINKEISELLNGKSEEKK